MAEQVKSEVKKVNRGDLATSHSLDESVKLEAKRIKNITHFGRNILPGYVVNRKYPSKDYAFYWWMEGTSEFAEEELEELKEIGYEFVNDKEFDVKKWNRTSDGRIKSGKYLLMYLSEEDHLKRRQERLNHLGNSMDEVNAPVHAAADALGLGTWEVRGGREKEIVKPRNRADKLLD